MLSDQSGEYKQEENATLKEPALPGTQPISLPLFAVQLQNIVPVEIVAKRFPDDIASTVAVPGTQLNVLGVQLNTNVQLNIEEPLIDIDGRRAQVVMDIKAEPVDGPWLFEISLKLVGLFTYTPDYSAEMVRQFLQQGSLSVLLPSARELLLSICNRLQLPAIVLPLVQLAPPPETKTEDTSQ